MKESFITIKKKCLENGRYSILLKSILLLQKKIKKPFWLCETVIEIDDEINIYFQYS